MDRRLYSWWSKYMWWSSRHGWPWPTEGRDPIPPESHLIIGHRGSSRRYPENTILAFDRTIEEGGKGIEVDIRKTVDGVYVVMHDATVDRTTNGTGSVSDLTWDYLSTLDAGSWRGSEFAGRDDTKVPTLNEVLDRYQGEGVFLSLNTYLETHENMEIIDMLVSRGMLHQCFFFTERQRLGALKTHNRDVFVMNSHTGHDPWDLLTQAKRESWDAISVGVHNARSEVVAAANADGIYVQVSALGSNFQQQTETMLDAGVNFILGDDVAEMVSVVNRRGITQLTPGDIFH